MVKDDFIDDFTLLASAPSIVEVEARANHLCSSLVRGADGKQLAINPKKSSVTLFTSDIHQFRLPPQVRIGDAVAPLNRTPKILGCHAGHPLLLRPYARDCAERAPRALNVMKALAVSNWGFTTETLVATYKAIVRPILNYAAPIWCTKLSSSHLDKSDVVKNKVLHEDPDRLPSKGRSVLPHSRDWGPPPEGSLRTVLLAVLCQRPTTPTPQSPNRHLTCRPPPP